MGRRQTINAGLVAFLVSVSLASAQSIPPPAAATGVSPDVRNLVERIDRSLAQAGMFLVRRQDADGAWRSDVYGALRDGPSLTPYVLSALTFLPEAGIEGRTAFDRGVDYLATFVDDQGRLKVKSRELLFPVYTAASASRAVALRQKGPRNLQVQAAWLDYLRRRQLNESLGWQPDDPEYGGWGFSLDLPRKPAPGKPREFFCESNLSATVFGLAALKSAHVPDTDPSYRQALAFVMRCQNFPESPDRSDPEFDDGGFYFIPGDAVQNKAGIAGTDRFGQQRFRSYGTMTADGLRALLRCGLGRDHPRVVAARRWLEQNFAPGTNPGDFPGDRAVLQNATYYYWTWAAAHAFLALQMERNQPPSSSPCPVVAMQDTSSQSPLFVPKDWAVPMAEELLQRQRSDGTWSNRYTDAKEDDPLIATPWATAALAIARHVLSADGG